MSYIYKITNDINDKIYVGKTNLSLEKRFQEHIQDAQRKTQQHRPLYNAINKYGKEHFTISLIEECSSSEASEREIYWIGFYEGYEKGYNATLGGDGKQRFNHELIAQRLKEHPYPIDVANEFNCSIDLIRIIGKEYNIILKNKGANNVNAPKQIQQFDKNNNFIQIFPSIQKAAEWLQQNNYLKTINSGVRSHISDVANGRRKTAYQFIWKYIDY